MDPRPECKNQAIKHLQENIGENPSDLGYGRDCYIWYKKHKVVFKVNTWTSLKKFFLICFLKNTVHNEKGKQGQYLKHIDLTKDLYLKYIIEFLSLNKVA